MRVLLFIQALLAAGLPAAAQNAGIEVTTTPAPVEGPAAPLKEQIGDASEVRVGPLMAFLKRTMVNKPVVVVTPLDGAFNEPEEGRLDAERTLVGKMQVISAACSPDNPLIPFRIRNTWTIAPERIAVIDLDAPLGAPEDVLGRRACFERFISEADAATARALSAESGVPVMSLPPAMRSAIQAGLRAPFRTSVREPLPSGEGLGYSVRDTRVVEEAPDWSRTRVRARLSVWGVEIPVATEHGASNQVIGVDTQRPGGYIEFENGWSEVEMPGLAKVRNRLKPSDLDGRRLGQPVGISGVVSARAALAQIARVSGLKLYSGPLRGIEVFIGHRDIPAGEVLDAMRLGLEAAFRSIGDGYVLAWDVRGLGALQQLSRERAAALLTEAAKWRREQYKKTGLLTLAETLPFCDDDPIRLTAAQREKLLEPRSAGDEAEGGLRFGDLTPEQQAQVRKMEEGRPIYAGESTGGSNPRPVSDADLAASRIGSMISLEIEVQTPGEGWRRIQNGGWGYITAGRLDNIRRAAEGRDPMEEDVPPELMKPEPVSMPAGETALLVPVLGPSRLATLSDEMKRHGANVLFYPALYEGYATFPTTTFPGHPSLRGENGLEAALREMGRNGIRVVPYISVLAWQGAGQKSHWLTRHPDWLDRDIAGRTALEFWEANGRTGWSPFGSGAPAANYVRAAEPEVGKRLKALLADLLKKPGVGDVFLTDWCGDDVSGPLENPATLSLGYALPERIQAVKATGVDPIDIGSDSAGAQAPASAERLVRTDGPSNERDATPVYGLLTDLVATARSSKPGVRVYLSGARSMFTRASRTGGRLPKADVTMGAIGGIGPEGTGGGLMLPIWARSNPPAILEDAPSKIRELLTKQSPLALFGTILRLEGFPGGANLKCVALDFREAPEEITDALQWLKPPEGPAAPKPLPRPAPAKAR